MILYSQLCSVGQSVSQSVSQSVTVNQYVLHRTALLVCLAVWKSCEVQCLRGRTPFFTTPLGRDDHECGQEVSHGLGESWRRPEIRITAFHTFDVEVVKVMNQSSMRQY